MKASTLRQRLAAAAAVVMLCAANAGAQTAQKHVVERGETLESIAVRYGVTTEDILKLNPDAAQFVYVGMELALPAKPAATAASDTAQTARPATAAPTVTEVTDENGRKRYVATTEGEQETTTVKDERDGWAIERLGDFSVAFEIGYGFLDNGGGDGSAYAYSATAGVNYYFTDAFYAGARIGYNSSNFSDQGIESAAHILMIPIETGYAFATQDQKFAVVPFTGFDFNIGLTGKTKIKNVGDYDMKIGGKIGVAFDLGLRVRLWGFNLSGSYHIPLNDRQEAYFGKDGYFKISLGFGF